jgi:hypothetical protein
VWLDEHKKYGIKCPVIYRGKITIMLWELMNIFGHEMFNGMNNTMFVDNDIDFDLDLNLR